MTDADDLTLLEQHDIDGDGIPEIVTGHKNYSKLAWQKFDNSPRRFSNPTLIPTLGGNPGAIEFSDLDGDGDQDLLVSFIEYEEKIVWFEKLDDGPDFGAEDTIAMMD
ncbi:FG-GAP-like repeat-containing protein, partial [Arthrospira platensis SPKY1]|nr:FG-GAP-like repeat-containing protein [Arthrospira platensis SPKY1]